ncbi:hypothetical protein BHE74_00017108 [Ensete ventricosum]|uniref:Uncharacterized protein n=1 Tax=Ensete ventricosum TaxID=4639 RepID=A0A427AJL4_ENSVE|nr:hypothetical protein B296_00016590 [Ensete ventricosum]RWW74898.1 hypothetical protein BHE74_00017108 [Ensete ventricosum]
MGSRTNMVSQKNTTVINFVQSLNSIGLLCTVSEFQNTSQSFDGFFMHRLGISKNWPFPMY